MHCVVSWYHITANAGGGLNKYQIVAVDGGICGFMNAFGVAAGLVCRTIFGKIPAATELGSLGGC